VSAPPGRLYRPRVSLVWWASRPTYTAFVLRELSSIFVAWTVVYLLLMVRAVARGAGEYQRFLDWSASPWLVALNVVALAFLVYHAVTFINLTPQAMGPVKLPVPGKARRRVPPPLLTGSIYLVWLVVSAFFAWLVMR
jgi:fumarate reductase subunit C